MTEPKDRGRTTFVRIGLQAWCKTHGVALLSWRFVGVCIEARVEVTPEVELRVIAPTLKEVQAQLASELSGYRRSQLRVIRGGKL